MPGAAMRASAKASGWWSRPTESDGTFLKLPTQIGVITNIDPEHMDYWPSLDALHLAFSQFIEAIPFYGLAVACIDHPVVRELSRQARRRRQWPPHRDLWRRARRRYQAHQSASRSQQHHFRCRSRPGGEGRRAQARRSHASRARPLQCVERARRARRLDRSGRQRRRDPLRPSPLSPA